MGRSTKSALKLAIIVLGLISAVVWMAVSHGFQRGDRFRPDILFTAIGFSAATAACALVLICLNMRRDLAHDHLWQKFGKYVNCRGLCFTVRAREVNGVARLAVIFQNQYERRCNAVVAVYPSRKFFMNREPIDAVEIPVNCPGGAFGAAEVCIAIPARLQGNVVKFDVGASVNYPHGKGKRLRFRDGVFLRSSSEDVTSATRRTVFFVLSILSPVLYYAPPVSVDVGLPEGVSELPQIRLTVMCEIYSIPEDLPAEPEQFPSLE